jgi:hypothetical protein
MHPLTHSDGTTDRRYSIQPEYCGQETQRWVLRYCGEFVAQSLSRSAMVTRAVGHRLAESGADIIVERRAE